MRKAIWTLLLWSLCGTGRGEGRLNLFIWSEYIDPEVVAEFERKEDCKVVIDLYEDEAAMTAKLRSGGAGLYDVVVPPDHTVPGLRATGLIARLRHENIPNLKNLRPKFRNPPFDPGNQYSVAYQWGTVGIYVRTSVVTAGASSWGVLFDPGLQPSKFALIDNPRDLIGAALNYRGHGLNSVDLGQLKEARDLIVAAKERCVGFDGSVGGKNKVLSRVADAAIVYSGEAARGMAEDSDTTFFIPKEGSQIWLDNLAVLAGAPHRDLAERFINFLLDPEIGARISNFTQCASPNLASTPFLKAEDLKNPVIYPPVEVMDRLEFLKDPGPRRKLYDELWTQIKTR